MNIQQYAPTPARWLIIGQRLVFPFLVIAAIAIVIGVFYAVSTPNTYKATVRLLPPFGEQDTLTVMQGAVGANPAPSWWEPEDTNEANFIIIGVLKSDRVSDGVIKQLDLLNRLNIDSVPNARRWLDETVTVLQDRHKLILIEVVTDDQLLSTDVANAFSFQLKETERSIRADHHQFKRDRVGARLDDNRQRLLDKELEFQQFKQKYGVVDIETQTRVAVELHSRLKELEAEELVELSAKSKFLNTGHEDMMARLARLEKIQDLTTSITDSGNFEDPKKNPSLQVLPDLQRKFLQFVHEIELLKEASRLLNLELEVVNVFDAGKFPETTILDQARVPDVSSSASVKKCVVLAVAAVAFIFCFCVVVADLILHFIPPYLLSFWYIRLLRGSLRILRLKPIYNSAL